MMKLQHKAFLMLITVIITLVGVVTIAYTYQNKATLESQLESASLDMALTIASIPQIQEHLAHQERSRKIQDLLLPLMQNTRHQYIIVFDMKGIQYSYPYESGLYKPYKAGGSDQVLESGESYVSIDTNELISAVRAFVPVIYEGEQVGAVLVGLLTTGTREENAKHVSIMEMTLVVGVIGGMLVAAAFSLNVKKSIFGLDPKEIAMLVTEKEMIFQNIERGILVIGADGRIKMSNKKALTLLGKSDVENEPIEIVSPHLAELVRDIPLVNQEHYHKSCVLEVGTKVLLHICPLFDQDKVLTGRIISMEDMTYAKLLAEELTDYRSLVDSLRAQNHEFMNKLQTISGLIQLNKYEKALDYIDQQARSNQMFNRLLTEKIEVDDLSALILAKYERASERKITFLVDEESYVSGLPVQLSAHDACTILGNLLDNSMEALCEVVDPSINLYLYSDEELFELELSNNGPSIDASPETLFAKGHSTKGEGRGFGLYLIHSIIEAAGGTIYWLNEPMEVTWFVEINNNTADHRR